MRWLCIIIFYYYFLPGIICQPGFSKLYDLGESFTMFLHSAWIDGDTLAVYGIAYSDEIFLHQQGLVFAKIDTNGNALSHWLYFDSLGGEYTVNLPASFVKMKDGSGYLLLAQILSTNTGVLLKIDNDGNLLDRYEFEDTLALTKFYRNLIETSDSYYIAGAIQRPDYQTDLFVIRIDKSGKKLWEKSYGLSSRRDYTTSFFQRSENELVIGSITISLQGTPDPQKKFSTKIFGIDSIGTLKYSWESPISTTEGGSYGLFKSSEGFWYYMSGRAEYNEAVKSWFGQPKFIKRDSNFNLVHEKLIGVPKKDANGFTSFFPTQDGGWFAAGEASTWSEIKASSGWMYKLDQQGDSLWSRMDTAQAPGPWNCQNTLWSAFELPSGSIIACGYSERLDGPKPWGWLIKVDKNGCIDTLNCHPVSQTAGPGQPGGNLKVFPNPVRGTLHFADEIRRQWDRIEVMDALGQSVMQVRSPVGDDLDLSGLCPGVYYVRFVLRDRFVVRTVVKI